MISLNSQAFLSSNQSEQIKSEVQKSNCGNFFNHQQWNHESGWKNTLNNLRLIAQPLFLFWLIYPWLDVSPNSGLLLGFNRLISAMNQLKRVYSSGCFSLFTTCLIRQVTEEVYVVLSTFSTTSCGNVMRHKSNISLP